VILVTLMSHPLLDSFTVYGTQLFWPLPMRPLMWSSLFIIDPLFLLPWLVACVVAWFARERIGRGALVTGIALGVAYVGWSLVAKTLVDRDADRALAAMGIAADAPRFSVPMPLNTVLWRVVAMTPSGYVEGFRSLAVDDGPMRFTGHPSNVQSLREAGGIPAVQRLTWFNHGFERARVVDGTLEIDDLRMGSDPDYFFRFAVARREDGAWTAIAPRRLASTRDARKLWG
jgi:inner membrane protein